MGFRILLLDASKLHSATLKSRLESLGAEVVIVESGMDLLKRIHEAWDMAIAESELPGSPEKNHLRQLKQSGKPVLLWTDDAGLLNDATTLALFGLEKCFRKLNRADLLHEAEILMQKSATPGPRSFLLVEDSPTVRAYVSRILSDRFPGAEVIHAEDGRKALSAMRSNRVDLIVTDLQMPGMDGQSFVSTIRSNSILAKKPVVILSGMITDKVREEMRSITKLCLLAKPASPEELEGAVRGLLAQS